MSGLSTRSAARVTKGALTMSHTSTLWYASTAGLVSLAGPTTQRSHQYGRVQAVGVVEPRGPQARSRRAAARAWSAGRCARGRRGCRGTRRRGPS